MKETGQTFRLLLQALNTASGGRPVLYVCQNMVDARRCATSAFKMASAYLKPGDVNLRMPDFVLELPNRNHIFFTTSEEVSGNKFKGLRNPQMILDGRVQ